MDRGLKVNPNAGHRARLRERFMRAGLEALNDYEALELLLTYAIQRRDVKPAAKRLLEDFGTVERVLDASPAELLQVPGLGGSSVAAILLIRQLCTKYLEQKSRDFDLLDSPEKAVNYLRMKLGGGKLETFMVLFLNSQNHLITSLSWPGTVDRAVIYPRNVLKAALLCNATGVIAAHNHPSGVCEPSPEDIQLTVRLKQALNEVNVTLHDHLIVTPSTWKSLLGEFSS
ncbi:MAG: DNA repair protein RadC [Victivallaceae bacterium]|nr:DNA repair protein RadC [Victivallaceae bacterium]